MTTHINKVISIQGDTIDSICWQYYGRSTGIVELVLNANPTLAQHDVYLPIGTTIYLPNINTTTQQKQTIQLWE